MRITGQSMPKIAPIRSRVRPAAMDTRQGVSPRPARIGARSRRTPGSTWGFTPRNTKSDRRAKAPSSRAAQPSSRAMAWAFSMVRLLTAI